MNWLKSLFFKAAMKTFRFLPEWSRYAFLPVSLQRMMDGYKKNSAVSSCVTALAFSFPEAPLLGGTEEDGRFVANYSHPIMGLIRRPNPDMSEEELMRFAITYASVGGSLFLWKQRNEAGKPIRLWPFSVVNVTPLPGRTTEEGFVRGYEFDPGDGQTVEIPKEDIIQWNWMPDPEHPERGIGAVEFSIKDSDRGTETDAYIYSLLKNNAVPPVVVTLTEGDELTDDKADRLRKQWNVKMGGDNRGAVAFLEAGMKAEKMGFDLQQLAGETLSAVPEARIAAAFRVPPVVAGLSVGLKRSDYGDQAARRSFTELTLAALWRSLASELLNGLKDDFNLPDNFKLQFDLRQVRALQEEESKRWERVTLAFDRGFLTRAEGKQELGMKPGPGDDVYKVSLATEFIPAKGSGVVDRGQMSVGSGKWEAKAASNTLQRIRLVLARSMQGSVSAYFKALADRVVERLEGSKQLSIISGQKADMPDAGDLLTPEDSAELEKLIKRYYVEILELSWDAWNASLGITVDFALDDPLVAQILGTAGKHVRDIDAETLGAIQEALVYGREQGWGIDDIVRGDANMRGLRDIVAETYKDRARFIARSELGHAQNTATAQRYRDAGVQKVEILDGGSEDSAPACELANGEIWTVELLDAYPMQHPNCTRAATPYFGDGEARTSWPYAFGERG